MAKTILPEGARESLLLEEQIDPRHDGWHSFDRALKDLDPRLSLVKASENATAPGLTPGYWHVQRRNDPPAMDSYLILTGPNGEYAEPHSGHLEWLRSRDLQSKEAVDAMQREQFAKERARQAVVDGIHQERKDEFVDRYMHLASPRIAIPRAA